MRTPGIPISTSAALPIVIASFVPSLIISIIINVCGIWWLVNGIGKEQHSYLDILFSKLPIASYTATLSTCPDKRVQE